MSKFKILLSLFLVQGISFFFASSLLACYGTIYVCGNVADYICQANENCMDGNEMLFIDACYGFMEIEYSAGDVTGCP